MHHFTQMPKSCVKYVSTVFQNIMLRVLLRLVKVLLYSSESSLIYDHNF
jgi:hypothetical protein